MHSHLRAFCTRRSFIAVRYAENLMLFKSAARTYEKNNKTTARHPYLQGRKQQLQLPDICPTIRSGVHVEGGGAEPCRQLHPIALGGPCAMGGSGWAEGISHWTQRCKKGNATQMVLWQSPYPVSGTTPSSLGGPSTLSGPGGWKENRNKMRVKL